MNSTLLYDAAENKLLLRNVNMKGYKKNVQSMFAI